MHVCIDVSDLILLANYNGAVAVSHARHPPLYASGLLFQILACGNNTQVIDLASTNHEIFIATVEGTRQFYSAWDG